MNALLHLLRWDFTMQVRYGFWVAAVFVLAPWAAVALSVTQEQARVVIPALIFVDISIAGMLFMGGVYFFEKREGSLQALVVTPVETWQWLTSKLVALTVLGTVMCVVLVALKMGIRAPWGYVLIAIVGINALFTLIGFILAAPNERFTDFVLYFSLVFGVLGIPVLGFFGISHASFWILPSQPALVLLRGAFDGMPPTRFVGVLGLHVAWMVLAFYLCLSSFRRHVADRRGR
jgi:fluoroquinolone transport system permease protein